MKMRVGFEMLYDLPKPTPMIMVLGTHFTRASHVIVPDFLTTDPAVEIVDRVVTSPGAEAGRTNPQIQIVQHFPQLTNG